MTDRQPSTVSVPQRPSLADELARFREAVDAMPDVKERHDAGRQFNAYDIAGRDEDDEGDCGKFVCLGPIHSRPLSLVEAPSDVADLLTASLRVASCLSAHSPAALDKAVGLLRRISSAHGACVCGSFECSVPGVGCLGDALHAEVMAARAFLANLEPSQ